MEIHSGGSPFMLREKIKSLEKISKRLEPSHRNRTNVEKQIISYAEEFLKELPNMNTYQVTENKGIGLLDSPFAEDPASIRKTLKLIRNHVDTPGLNPASGGHLGYIPGGGVYYSSLGDYLAAVTNRYSGVFFANPGAVRMENMLIRWMGQILGYPKSAGGTLTSGGSIANLVAIVTARDAQNVHSRMVAKSAIYLTRQAHHSIHKALRIAGLKEAPVRFVPLDQRYRMIPEALEELIRKDRRKGIRPFLIIAAAGTTDTGAIDPLPEIGKIAKRHSLWYHIDAAYGGFFILTPQGKKLLRGIEMSDSVILDPHKGLFLPYGIGAVLVKDPANMQKSHQYLANYMQDTVSDVEEISPADVSPELTRHFRGMRMWLPLKLYGLRPFRACLEEKLMLAKYFYREVKKLGFETGPSPELSVVTYRYVPQNGDANELNRKLWQAIFQDGRIFISTTTLDSCFTLRFACLSFRTRLKHVDLLLRILRQKTKNTLRMQEK